MNKYILTLISAFVVLSAAAQDTVWVQSFNYDSETRDTMLSFPEGDHNQYEKILMYYGMRCTDGLISTPTQRNLGCGEWDYSCNTYVTDSSYVDSLIARHPSYIISGFSGEAFEFVNEPTYTYYQFEQKEIQISSVISEASQDVDLGQMAISHPFNLAHKSQRSYYLIRADELGGFGPGDITGLGIETMLAQGDLDFLSIGLANTAETEISTDLIKNSDFSQVYFLNSKVENSGDQQFNFHQKYYWNGTDNLLVEVYYNNQVDQMTNSTVGGETDYTSSAVLSETDGFLDFNESFTLDIPADGMQNISDQITVSFWTFGNPNALPKNTSIFHAEDVNGNRELNVHLPWSNGLVYWDAGNEGGYDRIQKEMTPDMYEGQWNHWAFTKNTETGLMYIYLNGERWAGGSGKFKPMDIQSFVIGSSNQYTNTYNGYIDDFSVWDIAMEPDQVARILYQKIDASNPDFANLVAYYDFNEKSGNNVLDRSSNALSATTEGDPVRRNHLGHQIFKGLELGNTRPNFKFYRGQYQSNVATYTLLDSVQNSPNIVTPYFVDGTDLASNDPYPVWAAGDIQTLNIEGDTIQTDFVNSEDILYVYDLDYYRKFPMDFELLSFVTPYGIFLDFGLEGRYWVFDVTEYAPILKGNKRFKMTRGGQWQEEMDIRFAFIKGTPPRFVKSIQQIWPVTHSPYTDITSNFRFEKRDIPNLNDNDEKVIKMAITGHGQQGEFIPRNHFVRVDGNKVLDWSVWKECADNPIQPQGGTWIYDRAGWCPGMPTDIRRVDITEDVKGLDDFEVDYSVSGATGDSRYIVNAQYITYGPPNFQNDAAMEKIISPTTETAYEHLNPNCGYVEVMIKNTGENPLTSVDIYYGMEGLELFKHTWTGNLASFETKNVILPDINAARYDRADRFLAYVENPNGVEDEYPNNNQLITPYPVLPYVEEAFVIQLRTNGAANETRWRVYDSDGNIVASRESGFSPFTTYTDTITNLTGCYEFYLWDTDEDGLSFFANGDGDGSIRVGNINEPLVTLNPDFGKEIHYHFTVGELVPNKEISYKQEVLLAPNPSSGKFNVELTGFTGNALIEVRDQLGRLVLKRNWDQIQKHRDEMTIDLSDHSDGIYYLTIFSGENSVTKKLVKAR